ncbi:PREDICTED: putative F-box protein At5g50220 [Camelina sativa]|uniref:F-box protein At5g50220 n=1 Tax=Camelina sativa TaxID=90675 RepID=A0ABM0WMJ4_CAMSA|nr:PREDICTED: putative F-box protein At5g50220 [Camelina sativa]
MLSSMPCQVFTLGDPNKKWMDIQCGIGSHYPSGTPVCINGVIYYKAVIRYPNRSDVLLSFDVRSQRFNHVQGPDNRLISLENSTLINYQGKLACICRNNTFFNKDVDMWVMENAEKQEWSKLTFLGMLQGLTSRVRIAKVTPPGGEVVVVHNVKWSKHASYVYYYDPKRNIPRRVEIQTTISSQRLTPSNHFTVWPVTDHVENITSL